MNKTIELLVDQFKTNGEDRAVKLLDESIKNGSFKPRYKEDFNMGHCRNANTLPTKCIGHNDEGKFTVYAQVHEDYYTWVNFFIVVFDDNKGYVVGDFEKSVYASSKKAMDKFSKYYQPTSWDYYDI